MEEADMAALRTRKEARERAIGIFMASLNQMIPEDESVALQGRTFRDFELQAQKVKEAVMPTLLEERAALDGQAQVESAGTCPHCGAGRTYLEKGAVQKEIRSPDGPVVLLQQQARCRACNGSFSPSGAGLVAAGMRAADESGRRTPGA
jgi:hypothetical protein